MSCSPWNNNYTQADQDQAIAAMIVKFATCRVESERPWQPEDMGGSGWVDRHPQFDASQIGPIFAQSQQQTAWADSIGFTDDFCSTSVHEKTTITFALSQQCARVSF